MLGVWSRFKQLFPLLSAGGCALFAGMQFLPVFPRTNPPVDPARTVDAQLEIAPPVREMLKRSCRDCHSNETRWPWYAVVAPASWKMAHDVNKARSVMNFSEWSEEGDKKLDKAIGLLTASCSDVQVGRMPKPEYVLLHSEAELSGDDKKAFCKWAMGEGRRLMMVKRRQPATQ